MVKDNPEKTAMMHVLLGFIPYTEENLMLTFKPNIFFNELEKTSKKSTKNLRQAFNRAVGKQLINIGKDRAFFSIRGRQLIQPFIAKKLKSGGKLMVSFDIPEDYSDLRRKLRFLLRELKFKPVQQSVWISDMDHRKILLDSIKDLKMQDWVQLYEAARIRRL